MSVILAAHGAGDGSEANRGLLKLADTLRARRPGVRFGCAFWKGTPSFEEAARNSRGQGPVVVPIMASDGYYARRRLPQEWAKGDPSRSFVIAPPIGTLPAFPCILATKVGEAVTDMTRRGLNPVVLLVGHGTTRVRSSGDAARWVRDELALSFPHTEILTAFLDESPYLSEVAGSLGGRPVVAAPLLLGGGPHVLVDLAGALRAPRISSGLGHLTETLKILPADIGVAGVGLAHPRSGRCGVAGSLFARPKPSGLARVRGVDPVPHIVARCCHPPKLGPGRRGPGTLTRVYICICAPASGVAPGTLTGRVWLVGAGPGDAGLITVRGRELLERADVVVYDRLAGAELLTLTRPDAELIDVFKAPGQHTVAQDRIHEVLIERGPGPVREVVRLKGGDPFNLWPGMEGDRGLLPCWRPLCGGSRREQRDRGTGWGGHPAHAARTREYGECGDAQHREGPSGPRAPV